MNKKVVLVVLISLTISILGGIVYYYSSRGNTQTEAGLSMSDVKNKSQKKVYEHTTPIRISTNDYFSGEFIANDVASIYPRRDALVKDILVDIGDKVKVGDTLAVLFEPGVEGEASSNIAIKSTQLQSKKNILGNVLQVKGAKLGEIDTKLREKQVLIKETEKLYNAKIAQIKANLENKGELEEFNKKVSSNALSIEESNLATLQESLLNAEITMEQKIKEGKENILQKNELLNNKINEIYLGLFPIIYIGKQRDINYERVRKGHLADTFSVKSRAVLIDLLDEVNSFIVNKQHLELEAKYEKLLSIGDLLILALQNSAPSIAFTDTEINNTISELYSFKQSLISNKEAYEDARNNLITITKIEEEKIKDLKKRLIEQEDVILLKESQYRVVDSSKNQVLDNLTLEIQKIESEKSFQVEKLRAELNTLRQSKKLLDANETKNVVNIKNEVSVAQANLNKQYVESKDYKITSAFSGIVSSRNIEVGQKVNQNTESFRLSGVTTSLSKKAKKEVKFYIPENVKDDIAIGDEIQFSFGNEIGKTYTGAIWRISPEVNPENLTLTVQARVDDSIRIPHKSTIRVGFTTTQEVFKIPNNTLYNKGERKIIYYKKDNGKLGVRDVEVISDDGEFLLVSGSIQEDLKIITTPIFIK